jgi:YegS/Rv2252/BmrU family lipid kinase
LIILHSNLNKWIHLKIKHLLIYNPAAGRGKAGKLLEQVKASLREHDLEFDLYLTSKKGDALQYLQTVELNQYDGVIASGGDGTLFEVVNGLLKNQGELIPIGILPVGTGNSTAKELNLETNDIDKALALISTGSTKDADVGRFETGGEEYYFINILGLGFVTDVLETANKFKMLGEAAYTIGVLVKTIFLKPYDLTIEIDDKKISAPNILVEVSNTKYTGGNFLMAPTASITDGYLDINILHKLNRRRLLSIFPKLFKGTHIHEPEIEYLQGRKISISCNPTKKISPDGELLGNTPITIECLPEKIRLYA